MWRRRWHVLEASKTMDCLPQASHNFSDDEGHKRESIQRSFIASLLSLSLLLEYINRPIYPGFQSPPLLSDHDDETYRYGQDTHEIITRKKQLPVGKTIKQSNQEK